MISKFEVAYFTASCDMEETNAKFAKSLGLDYPILSDPTGETAKAYGVLMPVGKMAKRWTLYVGKDGKILKIDKEVKAKSAGADLGKSLEELGVGKK